MPRGIYYAHTLFMEKSPREGYILKNVARNDLPNAAKKRTHVTVEERPYEIEDLMGSDVLIINSRSLNYQNPIWAISNNIIEKTDYILLGQDGFRLFNAIKFREQFASTHSGDNVSEDRPRGVFSSR